MLVSKVANSCIQVYKLTLSLNYYFQIFTGLSGYENIIYYKTGKIIKSYLIHFLDNTKLKLIRMLKTYVTFRFVHFGSKHLIFVCKHTLRTERLATGDFSVSALTNKLLYFFPLSSKQSGQQKRAY